MFKPEVIELSTVYGNFGTYSTNRLRHYIDSYCSVLVGSVSYIVWTYIVISNSPSNFSLIQQLSNLGWSYFCLLPWSLGKQAPLCPLPPLASEVLSLQLHRRLTLGPAWHPLYRCLVLGINCAKLLPTELIPLPWKGSSLSFWFHNVLVPQR